MPPPLPGTGRASTQARPLPYPPGARVHGHTGGERNTSERGRVALPQAHLMGLARFPEGVHGEREEAEAQESFREAPPPARSVVLWLSEVTEWQPWERHFGDTEEAERRPWTAKEDEIIVAADEAEIIASLPKLQGRSDDAVRNRWSRLKGGGDTTTASAPEEAAAAAAPRQADRGGEGGEGGAKGDGSGPDAAPPPVRRRSSTGSAGEDGGGGAKRERIGWTQAEDAIIISTVREIGHKWYRIAQRIPGRTEHAIRNRWQRLLRMVEDTQPPPSPSLFQAVGGAGPEEPAR